MELERKDQELDRKDQALRVERRREVEEEGRRERAALLEHKASTLNPTP